jgi:hypothetical protein
VTRGNIVFCAIDDARSPKSKKPPTVNKIDGEIFMILIG